MSSKTEQINLSVPSQQIRTPIYIGNKIFSGINSYINHSKYSNILVLTDSNVSTLWSDRIRKVLRKQVEYLIIPAGEKNKTLNTVQKIWTELSKKGFDRKSLVVNIGGGMVCDIGAFAASTFMRGISFVNVPTTLLAQADAAIGGKTGFNYNNLKNTIGTVSFPVAVICDSDFLTTLPKREYNSGMAEVIKYGIIADKAFFQYLKKETKPEFTRLISDSCRVKCDIVNKDPLESGLRKALNFGHTVGHAVEMVSQSTKKPLLHGEAIAIGMIAEARMSYLSGCISEKDFNAIESLIKSCGLPCKFKSSYKEKILQKMRFDKKNIKNELRWAFLNGLGNITFDRLLPERIVMEGINYVCE